MFASLTTRTTEKPIKPKKKILYWKRGHSSDPATRFWFLTAFKSSARRNNFTRLKFARQHADTFLQPCGQPCQRYQLHGGAVKCDTGIDSGWAIAAASREIQSQQGRLGIRIETEKGVGDKGTPKSILYQRK